MSYARARESLARFLQHLRKADQVRPVEDPAAKLEEEAPPCRRSFHQHDAPVPSRPDAEPAERRRAGGIRKRHGMRAELGHGGSSGQRVTCVTGRLEDTGAGEPRDVPRDSTLCEVTAATRSERDLDQIVRSVRVVPRMPIRARRGAAVERRRLGAVGPDVDDGRDGVLT